jgi:hypothetical protein
MLLASVVFAIQLARVCHPGRSRTRQAILGAILGPAAAWAASTVAFLMVFGPFLAVADSLPDRWLGPAWYALLTASALVFLALMFAAFKLSSSYAASAPA